MERNKNRVGTYKGFAVAAALALAIGCGGGVDRAPSAEDGGGGANGFGDDAGPTPAERTGATGDSNRGGGSGMAGLSAEARQFVQQASLSNQMEVALGNLAEDKAQSDQVRQFGAQLARDHEAANRELQSSIGGSDATAAQAPEVHQQMQQTQQKLERASGSAFDRAYLEEMVNHHRQDIQQFERAAQLDNSQVRQLAERMLPKLRQHFQQAQQLLESLSAQSGQNGD